MSATEEVPQEVRDSLIGLGLAAGGANVIMQLALLPVGHGVAKSTVESGRVDRHPIKRARTTSAFLVVAMLGSEQERRALRAQINRAHKPVHSQPGDPVQYDAFDPELQLWVAACLIQGALDIYLRVNGGEPEVERIEVLYQYAKRLGTTLQVKEEMFPADYAAFQEYWEQGLAELEMDELTRDYLRGVADLSFLVAPLGRLGAPLRPVLRRLGRFMTLGFLPQQFRDLLGLPWTERSQRRHDRVFGALFRIAARLPRLLREFPMNIYLWDTRRRFRKQIAVV